MNFIYFGLLAALLRLARAAGCWRNTNCTGPNKTVFPGPWEANIYAPASRTVRPQRIMSLPGGGFRSNYTAGNVLCANGSALVFDFGIEVGGIVTIQYTAKGGSGNLGLAFSEAKNWIGEKSDSSNGAFKSGDGAIYASIVEGDGSYVMPDEKLRGGFRYLTLFLSTRDTLSMQLKDISLEIGFQPTWANLRAYKGYFHSSDEELNRIWYSGAYTLQTNAVPVNTGRQVPMLASGWSNKGILGSGDTIIVDGAKRDRAVWPGDMGIAVPSAFVSTGDLDSVKNALQVMYDYQNKDGSFPEAGPPLLQQNSDTYHMWTMIGTYNYLLYSNDTAFVTKNWGKYVNAMNYIFSKVDRSGLLNVTGTRDWARWQTGGNGSEPNMILYRTLKTGALMASWVPNSNPVDQSTLWSQFADSISYATMRYCWNNETGMFRDNATDTNLYPQDANSMAILFDVIPANGSEAQSISSGLTRNWTPIGAESPELPKNISPFISSFEIQAHFLAGRADRALELIRRSWGWYLKNPNGTQSTVIEGYLTDGSFGYRSTRGYGNDPSYVSHAHGWSSGPTSALTEFLVGLSITKPAGSEWLLKPHCGDLKWAQAGFSTMLGKYEAKWSRLNGSIAVEWNTPLGTKGFVDVPGAAARWVEGGSNNITVRIL